MKTNETSDIRHVRVTWDQCDWGLKAYCDFNDRWNGFLTPRLERAEVEWLVDWVRKNADATDEVWSFDGSTLRIVCGDRDIDVKELKPETMEWQGKTLTVWHFAPCGYTWLEASNPRFMWLLPCDIEQFPDMPELPEDGSYVLWDRQLKRRVATVAPEYVQAVCLATASDDPFTHLAQWFNDLSAEDAESEGLTPTVAPFDMPSPE